MKYGLCPLVRNSLVYQVLLPYKLQCVDNPDFHRVQKHVWGKVKLSKISEFFF